MIMKPLMFSRGAMSSWMMFLMWCERVDSSVISSMNSFTSWSSPSMTSSTDPSTRFLIQPMTSNPSAI